MTDPLIDPSDLATYLNDPTIDTDRAQALIDDAQTLCESILTPLPTTASVVVKRVAARAYVTITSPRQQQLAAAGAPYAQVPSGTGGVYLTDGDKADLRRLTGGGGAFSIDMLPADYQPCLPPWDQAAEPGWWQ